MTYEWAHGYWRPEVRKHDAFNVTSFEKLDLDRKSIMSSFLLWHMSTPLVHNWTWSTAMITSALYTMGITLLCR